MKSPKATPPYQLVLIDNEGRQMLSMESDTGFTEHDLADLNRAIGDRQIDDEQEGGFWSFS